MRKATPGKDVEKVSSTEKEISGQCIFRVRLKDGGNQMRLRFKSLQGGLGFQAAGGGECGERSRQKMTIILTPI